MVVANKVTSMSADLYNGDDQFVYYVPDATVDDSGLLPSAWTVEMRFWRGRVDLSPQSQSAFLIQAMTWSSSNSRFEVTITKANLLTMIPGPWTMDVWRTNVNHSKLLLRVHLTVYGSVIP